ncbi:MAG: tetratricopeptide repeat protein [Candidatus Omnitrophota bacterium]
MKSTTIIAALVIALVVSLGGGLFLFLAKERKGQAFIQCEKLIDDMKQQVSHQEEENRRLKNEDKRLKKEAVSFLEITSQMKEEKARLEEEFSALKEKCDYDNRRQSDKDKENKQRIKQLQARQEKLENKITESNDELSRQKEEFRLEKAVLYYNLAVAYVNAGFYDLAEDTFRKSLDFDANNPDAYYNLGLLYEHFIKDRQSAARNYLEYLRLKPDAKDKDDVQSWIDGLR